MKKSLHFFLQCAFMLALICTLFEFLFIQGLFTWLFSTLISLILGVLNVLIFALKKQWKQFFIYIALTFLVCGGYFLYALQNP